MSDQYDVIIVGAGPGGIFCAYEKREKRPDLPRPSSGEEHSIEKRYCPKRKTKHCNGCHPCAITTGFAGAGAFRTASFLFHRMWRNPCRIFSRVPHRPREQIERSRIRSTSSSAPTPMCTVLARRREIPADPRQGDRRKPEACGVPDPPSRHREKGTEIYKRKPASSAGRGR